MRLPSPSRILTPEQAAAELAALADEIAAHDRAYYPGGRAGRRRRRVRRAEAAQRRDRGALPELVREDSRRGRSARRRRRLRQGRHARPMLSLANAFSEADLVEFVAGIRRFLKELRDDPGAPLEMMAEPKIDGLSVSLRYEDGRFVVGATRGDGSTGENVTANLRTLADIPSGIEGAPSIFEVRGEVYMTRPTSPR